MPRAILCPLCRQWITLPDDHVGGHATCSGCGAAVPVPPAEPRGSSAKAEAIQVELVEDAGVPQRTEPSPVTRRPPQHAATCPDCGQHIPSQARSCPYCNARLDDDQRDRDDDDRDEPRERRPRWKPCPRCGYARAKQVTFTFWGSFYGPVMLSHVRCRDCGYGYNGKTGKSNFWPAFFFVLVPAVLIVAIVGGFVLWIWYMVTGGAS